MNTLTPLPEPFPDDVAEVLDRYPKQDGYLLQLFRVFARSPRFLTRCVPNLLDDESPLSLREREIVILRTCSLRSCEYEWGVHVAVFARAAGLADEQVAATHRSQPSAECWSSREANLLRVVDGLLTDGKLSDELLQSLRETWTASQQLEIFALCGTYQTISFVANHAELELEAFARSFPSGGGVD